MIILAIVAASIVGAILGVVGFCWLVSRVNFLPW